MKTTYFTSLLFGALTIALFFTSCASKQRYVYLKDMIPYKEYEILYKEQTTVRQGDMLSITVSSNPAELAIPFNNPTGNVAVSERGEVSTGSLQRSSTTQKKGYIVNTEGNIDFPVLGILHVDGMTLDEIGSMIKYEIINGDFIKNQVVSIEFINFRFYVLGAAGNGLHSTTQERITLLEAIAMTGGISENGRADKVFVIRRNGNTNVLFEHNLESAEIFSSPAFYLQQNDIIYVEPKKRIRSQSFEATARYLSLAVSTITSVFTLIYLFSKQ